MMAMPSPSCARGVMLGGWVNQPVSRMPMVIRKAVAKVTRKKAMADRMAGLVLRFVAMAHPLPRPSTGAVETVCIGLTISAKLLIP